MSLVSLLCYHHTVFILGVVVSVFLVVLGSNLTLKVSVSDNTMSYNGEDNSNKVGNNIGFLPARLSKVVAAQSVPHSLSNLLVMSGRVFYGLPE